MAADDSAHGAPGAKAKAGFTGGGDEEKNTSGGVTPTPSFRSDIGKGELCIETAAAVKQHCATRLCTGLTPAVGALLCTITLSP